MLPESRTEQLFMIYASGVRAPSSQLIAGLPEDGSTIVPSVEIPLLVAKLIEGVQPDGETSKDHWHGSPNQVLGRVYVSLSGDLS